MSDMEQNVEVVENQKRTRKENANYDELFKDVSPEDAYQIVMDAKNSEMKADEYLESKGYAFTYNQLSTYLTKNGYTTGWYKVSNSVVIPKECDVELVSLGGKVSSETAKAWKSLDLDITKDAKSIVLDNIIKEANEKMERGELCVVREKSWQDEIDAANKEQEAEEAEFKAKLSQLTKEGNYEEIMRLTSERTKNKK